MDIRKGSVVIYENRRCKVDFISNTKVVLTNLDKKDNQDWSRVEIELQEL